MGIDLIGSIAILDKNATKKQANELLRQQKHIKTVLRRAGIYKGKYRTRKLSWLAGIKTKETIHKESGCLFKLDCEKCYFSGRSGHERLRITKLIKPAEKILVMFSGIAPLPIILSKHTLAKEIYGIEINPICHKYALENLKLNKTTNIRLFKGDVKKILPKIKPDLKEKFDRILMPLPKSSELYLNLAKKYIKKQGIIHLYIFLDEKQINKKYVEKLIKKHITKFKIQNITKAGVYSPRTYRVCVDFKVL